MILAPLETAHRLGPFEIIAALRAGGMGAHEVVVSVNWEQELKKS